jgi:hypothetical protein
LLKNHAFAASNRAVIARISCANRRGQMVFLMFRKEIATWHSPCKPYVLFVPPRPFGRSGGRAL